MYKNLIILVFIEYYGDMSLNLYDRIAKYTTLIILHVHKNLLNKKYSEYTDKEDGYVNRFIQYHDIDNINHFTKTFY